MGNQKEHKGSLMMEECVRWLTIIRLPVCTFQGCRTTSSMTKALLTERLDQERGLAGKGQATPACLRAGGGPNADECASAGALASRPSAKMAFSLVGGCGKVSVMLVQKPRSAWSFITRHVTRINVPFQAGFTLR